MKRLFNGVLVGFGSALSIIVFVSWHFLSLCLDSGYLIVGEAKLMEAIQITTNVGVVLGILLVVAGLGMELLGRKKRN
jgi:hypothetical protein